MPVSLYDWLFGNPYQSMTNDIRRDVQNKYGTNDQPPLRSVDDPKPPRTFHDRAELSGPTQFAQAAIQPPDPQFEASRRQLEQQQNVPQDRTAIIEGMKYGPQNLYGQMNLLPQYQSLGAIRPFGPGEWIQHPDPVTGEPGISSEETVTTQFPDGRWGVIPSLWLVNGRAVVVDEATAVQYAMQSGLNWPMFGSQADGDLFAEQREKFWNSHPMGRTDLQPPLWTRQFPSRQQ